MHVNTDEVSLFAIMIAIDLIGVKPDLPLAALKRTEDARRF